MGLKRLIFSLAIAAVSVVSASKDGSAAADEAVVTLTSATFKEHIEKNPLTLVEFYAPWCGHCKKLAPEYEAAAKHLKENGGIPLAKVDATEERELAQEYKIQGFPTLYFFRKGVHEPYNGGRTKDAILDWIEMVSGPAVVEHETQAAAERAANAANVGFLGVFASKDDANYKHFSDYADGHRDLGKYFAYFDPSSKAVNTVSVHRKDEKPVSTPYNKDDAETLGRWFQAESFPLLGTVNGETFGKYAARSDNWIWFAATSEDVAKTGDHVRKVSKNYRNDFNFVWLDVDQFGNHAKGALGLETFPGIAMQTPEGRYLYTGDITEKGVTKFIEAVRAGKVAKHFKSAEAPETNDEPVKVIVGKTFEDMVLKSGKDVLLEIYAPWCGHCKQLQPIYEEFAASVVNSKHLTVAKMDGTENEIPFKGYEVSGFPTLYFIPDGAKEPMPFKGARTVEGFTEFVKEHAKHPIVVSDAAGKDEL